MSQYAIRLRFSTLFVLATIGMLLGGDLPSSFALDSLPRSPRVGSLRIPLLSYNRVPISKLLSDPADYHRREIRIVGTVRTMQTRVMTQSYGVPYELTVILLEDGSGMVDIIDKGACGRNRSPLRAPTLAAGDLVDLLVQVVGGAKTEEPAVSPEVILLWIDRAQE